MNGWVYRLRTVGSNRPWQITRAPPAQGEQRCIYQVQGVRQGMGFSWRSALGINWWKGMPVLASGGECSVRARWERRQRQV